MRSSRRTRIFIYLAFISMVVVGGSSFTPALPPNTVSAEHDHDAIVSDTFEPMQISPCKRRCVDPHPGQFKYWNGQQNGCWIQVWRAWPDGCQHFQWFNSCNGYWDVYPDGRPKVSWTCCVH